VNPLGLEFLETRVRVTSERASDLEWLREFLCPPLAAAEFPDGFRVDVRVDPAAYAERRTAGPHGSSGAAAVFGFDTQVLRLPEWKAPAGSRSVYDAEAEAFLTLSGDTREARLLARAPSKLVRLLLMRVVREVVMSAQRAAGRPLLHAAAFARDGRGVALAGEKGAGKTTLLASLLARPGSRYVSNDRVVLREAGGRVVVRGLPTLTMVREKTLQLLPALGRALDADGVSAFQSRAEAASARERPVARDGRVALSPDAFCALLGAGRVAEATLERVVFPRLDPAVSGFALTRLPPADAAARLRAARFAVHAPLEDGTLFDLGETPPPSPPFEDALATGVACFECRLGSDAYVSEAKIAALERAILDA
jgi:hypothetical protein